MRLLLVALFGLAFVGPASADAPAFSTQNGGPRVRPNDGRAATLLRVGLDRSPTLRALVDRIERSQVIVYLEMEPRLRRRLSGCLTWVAAVDRFRYVRASINPDLAFDQQIAAVGHELQHVLEIAEHPDVVSEPSLIALYRRIGLQRPYGGLDWDTIAARDTGSVVRRELARMPTAADAQGPVTPLEWHTYYQRENVTSQNADSRLKNQGDKTRRAESRTRQ